MIKASPIAIVGRGCVLPDCFSPDTLWQTVINKQSLIKAPPENIWGLSHREAVHTQYPGAFIQNFADHFNLCKYDIDIDPKRLDPVFQWSLKATMDAWREAGIHEAPDAQAGVILANLSYPSRGMADYAGDIWASGQSNIHPFNAFNSGLPAKILARALKINGTAFALDAACASSLYALHLAQRKLTNGSLDIAVVCAVNAADNLMLHRGFEALNALSSIGQSRPFSTLADGLVPAEGAAAVVLKRLADVQENERIYGIIKGVGISNDGRRRGLLAPDQDGQFEAMTRAYQSAGIDPETIDYLECHATGTPVGDGVELRSASKLYGDRRPLPVGSLKSNTGHLITVAGLASLLKMTSAFEHETLPPTRLDEDPIDSFNDTCLMPLTQAKPWVSETPRRTAISNFGFGGNNAHLILEQAPAVFEKRYTPKIEIKTQPSKISICGIGLLAGTDRGGPAIIRRLMSPPHKTLCKDDKTVHSRGVCSQLMLNPGFARVPPADLMRAQAQQLAVLDVCEEALDKIALPSLDKIGVFVGMGCASDSTRWLLRERLDARLQSTLDHDELEKQKQNIVSTITSADVLGAMPNMPANRINTAGDFRGQGFTVSAEEDTSNTILSLAIEALEAGEIDMAIVAAADFASDPIRAKALAETGMTEQPADLDACLILKRTTAVDPTQDHVYATFEHVPMSEEKEATQSLVEKIYGSAPIADGLFHMAASALLADKNHIASANGASPWLIGDARSQGSLSFPVARPASDPLRPPPVIYWTAARSPEDLIEKIKSQKQMVSQHESNHDTDEYRLFIIASTQDILTERLRLAQTALEMGQDPSGNGIFYGEGKSNGELAFVYTGSAAAYPRMGRNLFMAFPELARRLDHSFPDAKRISNLLTAPNLTAYEQLCAVTLLSQTQTLLLRDMFNVKPDAALGLSLGETNSLIAFAFWEDAGYLLDEIAADKMYEHHLGGQFETAREAWGADKPVTWVNWRIYGPIKDVRRAIPPKSNVEITIIYSPEDCVIGGPPAGCKAVADALGAGAGMMMNQHLIVHAKAMLPYAETWRTLHTRPTSARPNIRIYSNTENKAYTPTTQKVADVLTQQATSTINFPKTVEQAYQDGVRTFVEIGPRDTLSVSIGKILDDRPHLALATDRIEKSDLEQIAYLIGALYADGRNPNIKLLDQTLIAARNISWSRQPASPTKISTQAHTPPPKIEIAIMSDQSTRSLMPKAPSLARPNFQQFLQRGPAPKSVPTGKIALQRRQPVGPSFTREELEAATTGKISKLFGPEFASQDKYERQVRLPTPPMLLVDRITGIDAEPTVESAGVIWTETDVKSDAWYMHDGFMRPGPLIEAGQADLTLISWMGADLQNQNERVYRLLGCELTLHEGGLPRAGDTLKYQIEITGHATLNGVRMFFFQYDCYTNNRRLFSVRNGQAGFFTDEELAAGKGVLWSAHTDAPPTAHPVEYIPAIYSKKTTFSNTDLDAFRQGDAYKCFGDGFENCAPQTNPPRGPDGKLALIDEISAFDPKGGPWQRGYLKAEAHVPQNEWFYKGHFHNDSCMPGTLMAEAAVQALEFYAAAIGMTITADGFVFEPVTDEAFKFICRGQVIPDTAHQISYEIFIDEIIDDDNPVLFAALLATSDGKKVFYCPRFGVKLRRNWPIVPRDTIKKAIGPKGESRGDWAALKACGDGAPSDAFGAMYEPFDKAGRVPRLPQSPYHFVSRVNSISTRPNMPEAGATSVTEFDIDPDAWYFKDNANNAMPFAVLVEVVLQPCGWLASHGGFALTGGECFRNLDGNGKVFHEIKPTDGFIRVESTMTRFSKAGPMTIVFFELTATLPNGDMVMELETSFGFFPLDALVRQAGLKTSDEQRAHLALPENNITLPSNTNLLPKNKMQMLDRVDYFDPKGGERKLGFIRGQQNINPYAWYFKAHFYQDPVQPGSLGLDALVQLLKRAVILKGFTQSDRAIRFESVAVGEDIKWSYRGQVTPSRKQVTTVIEITQIRDEGDTILITASGSLWCDNLRIYDAEKLSVRIVNA